MIWKPKQLGRQKIEERELEADKKNCRRFGPCGVGQKALYLNSFYFDRRYYVALDSVSRVFKRVAMSLSLIHILKLLHIRIDHRIILWDQWVDVHKLSPFLKNQIMLFVGQVSTELLT